LSLAVALLLAATDSYADVIYVVNNGNNTIEKFDSVTGADLGLFASTGLHEPTSLAFDKAGNLFVSNYGDGSIVKFTPAGVPTVFATHSTDPNLAAPQGLAFDSAGNLYVANWGGNTIEKYTPQGVGSVFATGLNYPADLAFDKSDNLYVANNGDNNILKFTPGGVRSVFATSPTYYDPLGLAFDPAGNLFVANVNSHNIEKFTPAGLGSFFASNVTAAVGFGFDSTGTIYVVHESAVDANLNYIDKYAPDGTYLGLFANAGLSMPFDIAIQVPEPSALALLALGIPTLFAASRRDDISPCLPSRNWRFR
jgi:DNA-binding beta-propeller fold protein YncE